MSEILLLDSNVLIALSFTDHLRHRVSTNWLMSSDSDFATCPITQGAHVRFAMRHAPGERETAKLLFDAVITMENHVFWPDDLPYTSLPWRQVHGHKQVTDVYLVALAENHNGRLATLAPPWLQCFPKFC